MIFLSTFRPFSLDVLEYRSMGGQRRGVTIGSYLAALTVFAIFFLTMVTMATQHLHFSSMAYQQQAAKNLAEAAIHQTLVKILDSPNQNFGVQGLVSEVVRVDNSLYPAGSQGIVSFHRPTCLNQHIPWSLNNFNGAGQILGSLQRTVPLNTLHIVGTGRCGEAKKTLEALFYIPPFPSALASEGPIVSSGPLLVARFKDPSKFTGHYAELPPEEKSPSHVFSNSNADPAVDLGAGADIKGNVGAVGRVQLAPNTKLSGEKRSYSDPQPN